MNTIDFAPDLPDSPPRVDLSGPVPTIDGVPVWPIFGATAPMGRHGILSSGDVIGPRNLLLSSLADGFDLSTLWTEFQDLLDEWNTHRTSLPSLLRFPVTEPGSAVPQGISGVQMELATEYGVPQSVGPPVEAVVLGYKRDEYDTRNAFSWRYLKSASVENVRAVMNSILKADNRLVNGLTMHRLFSPAPNTPAKDSPRTGSGPARTG
jgi:hypothetical protein